MAKSKKIHDPALYERMSVPKTRERFDADTEAFNAEFGALREKYGLQNVVHIITHPIVAEGKSESSLAMVYGLRGDEAIGLVMVASILGVMRREREEVIDAIASGKEAK